MCWNKKSTTNTTTDSATHNTVTPSNPSWVSGGLAGIGNTISNLNNLDPYSLVAPANPLQTQAGSIAAGLGGTSGAVYRGALDGTGAVMGASAPQTSGVQASGYIPQYMNPYTDAVVKSSLAGYDQNSNLQNQQANLDLAGDSTFGGSGGSIYKALLGGQQGLGRGQLEAQLRDQGFQTALGAAQADAQRQQGANDLNAQLTGQGLDRTLSAAGQLGDLGGALDSNTRANTALQGTIGDQLRQIDQQGRTAPISTASALSGLWGSLPLGLLHGETQDGTEHGTQNSTSTVSDPLGSIGSLMMGLGALGSMPLTSFGGAGAAGAGGLGGLGAFAGGAPTLGGSVMNWFKGLGH